MRELFYKSILRDNIRYTMSYTDRRNIECLAYSDLNRHQWIASLDAKLNRQGNAIEIIDILSRRENCGYGSALLMLLFENIWHIESAALSEVCIVAGGLSPFTINHWGKLVYFYNKAAQAYPKYKFSIRAKGVELHPQEWQQAVQLCRPDNSFAYAVYEKSNPIKNTHG